MCASRTGNSCRPNWKDSMGFAVLPVNGNKTKDLFPPCSLTKFLIFIFTNQERETFQIS